MNRNTEQFLARLGNVKKSQDGWTARCPAHDDRQNSLSIHEGDDGRVLVKCFAGCTAEAIVESLGITLRILFDAHPETPQSTPLTVTRLAQDKALPADFLRSLGLDNRQDGVLIPYANADGSPASRHRLRTSIVAKDGSIWLFGKGKPVPYGLDRLSAARETGYLVLVEGESDCWTLWFHGFPALGIPGASMTGKLELDHVEGIDVIFVVQEPGSGGEAFVDGAGRRLDQLGWSGQVKLIQITDAKDPNELHQRDPEKFKAAFPTLLEGATLLAKPPRTGEPKPATGTDSLLVDSGIAALGPDSTAASLECALRKLADGLRGADRIHKMSIREAAITHLKTAGLGSPAKLVDAAIGTASDESEENKSGRDVMLSDPVPWPEPTNGPEVLEALLEVLRRHVVMATGAAEAIALWVMHCYLIEQLYISPILAITSPLKRCGKSTLLELIGNLVPRLLLASNISPAALFRSIDEFQPTLLIDEADTFLAKNDELRGILNAGHTRGTAVVVRTAGDKHEPRIFSTWCPKAIAKIGPLPGTLEDRSVAVAMRRRKKQEKVESIRRDRIHAQLEPLRRKAARWAADNADAVRRADPEAPSFLQDRALDNWRPLLAIADAIGGEWSQRARESARALSGAANECENAPLVQLLADLRQLFAAQETTRLGSDAIVQSLVSMEDRPWPEWRQGRPLSKRQLARLLQPIGVRPGVFRLDSGTVRGYQMEDLHDAFDRYLDPESDANDGANNESDTPPGSRSVTSVTSAEYQAKSIICEAKQTPLCYGTDEGKKDCNSALVTDVTDQRGDTGDNEPDDRQPDEEFEV